VDEARFGVVAAAPRCIAVSLWPPPRWDIEFWRNAIVDAPAPPEARGALIQLVKRMAEREGFLGLLVTGPQGCGKSMFALKLGRAVYGDYSVVLRHCLFFKWEELRGALVEAARGGYRYPFLVWDDAGVWAGRYLYRSGPKRAEEIAAMMQLARTQAACIAVTAPSVADLAAFLRERGGWAHVVLERPPALAKLYRRPYVVLATMSVFREKPFKTEKEVVATAVVDVAVPDTVYRRYYAIRRKYVLELQRSITESEEEITDA